MTVNDEHWPASDSMPDLPTELVSSTPIVLSNEFAFVEVCVTRFGNGERLAVTSPSRGTTVHLDPVVLEILSGLDSADLRRLVARDLD